MASNTGIIIILAYPETVVMVADEWYSTLLRYVGIGKKNYVRAGHAALVLIDKNEGVLEYHDFGRYITNEPNGRVRGAKYDGELRFPIKAKMLCGRICNLEEVLAFLSVNSSLTHGDGRLVASVCDQIDYDKAKNHIQKMQRQGAIPYAAFKKNGTNCARFVTTTLIASVTDNLVRKKLISSQRFTPSTVGNVVLAASQNRVFNVINGVVSDFNSTVFKENIKYFLDRLSGYKVSQVGKLESKFVKGIHEKAQWLPGIAAGAWYEFTKNKKLKNNEYRFRRISPSGNVDVDAVFSSNGKFLIDEEFKVIHNSNCFYCTIIQNDKILQLGYLREFN